MLNVHQEERQCSRHLGLWGKIFYAFSEGFSTDGQPKGEGRARRMSVQCVCLSPAFMKNLAQRICLSQLLVDSELLNPSQA